MILPIKGLRARDLPRDLLPNRQILKSYKDVGKEGQYERTVHDRAYDWFWTQINASKRLGDQLIEQKVSGLMRVCDSKDEWLVYNVSLYGNNWEGNRVDFSHIEDKVTDGSKDGLPKWSIRIDPAREEIDYSNTQITEHEKTYTIPFTREKLKELIPFMQEPHTFMVQMPNGKRENCSEEQFADTSFTRLIDELTGFTEYMKNKLPQPQLKRGGAR